MRCDASSAAGADGQTGRDQQAAVICPMPGQLRNNDVLLAIRHLADAYLSAVTAIVLGLPDCFTTDVPGQIERDAAGQDSWVLTDVGTVAGFAVAARRPLGGTEILWIAVDPARRGQRIDTALLDRVPVELVAAVVSVVEAKTPAARPDPGRAAGYSPYEATRAFWEHNGFIQIDTISTARPCPAWPNSRPHGCKPRTPIRPTAAHVC